MDTGAFSPSALTYRRFEQRVYRARWLTLPFALVLVLVLHPSALWLSLVALAGYALHNLIRGVLIARGTLTRFRWGGGALLALDCTVVLLGLWPLLDTGEARAGQIALLALLGEIMQRLRLETRRVLAVGSTGATLALIAYVLFVARHGGSWRNTVIWIALFILVAVAGNTHRRWLPGYRPFRIRGNEERFPEPSASSPLKQPELPSAPLPASGVSPSESVLTSRQREVLRLAERRKPTREIADVLGISEETVKTHLRDAAKLLGTHTRFQAARVARERGWLD